MSSFNRSFDGQLLPAGNFYPTFGAGIEVSKEEPKKEPEQQESTKE